MLASPFGYQPMLKNNFPNMYKDYHKPDFCAKRCVQPDPKWTNPPLKYPDDSARPIKLGGFELAIFNGLLPRF